MIKFLLNIFCLTYSLTFFSQNNLGSANDISRVALTPFVYDKLGNMNEDVKNALSEKLNEIASTYATAGSGYKNRFIITANVLEKTKSVTNTVPIMYAYNLQFNIYIGDGLAGIKFHSLSLNFKGVGKTEESAYLMALDEIDVSSDQVKTFVENGIVKIIEYYNSQCDFILKDAQTLAGIKNYDEAIYSLASVPEVCKDCYNKCLDKITEVYKVKIENECQQNIAKAKTLMAQENYNDAASMLSAVTPDMQCYTQASSVIKDINDHKCAVALGEAKGYWVSHDFNATSMALSSIPSDSKCYAEAMVLAKEVENYVKETEKRDFDVMKQQMKNEQDSKMATIKAARDIGVAYGSNQPKTITTYNIKGWW